MDLQDVVDLLCSADPNGDLNIIKVESEFRSSERVFHGNAELILKLSPVPKIEIIFQVSSPRGFEILEMFMDSEAEGKLTLGQSESHIDVIISRSGNDGFTLVPSPQRLAIETWKPTQNLILGLVNHKNFFGQSNDDISIEQIFPKSHAIQMQGCCLNVVIEAVPDIESKVQSLKEYGGYAVSHIARISKCDATKFTSLSEAKNTISALVNFLSFSCGTWVTPIVEAGYSFEGQVQWLECCVGKHSPWKVTEAWTDEHLSRDLYPNAFGKFMNCYTGSFRESLTSSIHWYLLSNLQVALSDGSLALSQIALEILAWSSLVIDGNISVDGFSRLSAADQLRLLFSICNIPVEIPNELPELQKVANEFNFDGPDIISQSRNAIIHPTHSKKDKLLDVIFYTWLLSQWYIELVILSKIGYVGDYSNRLRMRGWKGEREKVPWNS